MKGENFPWEHLKAGCLRLICSQLLLASNEGHTNVPHRKEEMITFLHAVNERGLEPALKSFAVARAPSKSQGTPDTNATMPPSSKRKTSDFDDDEVETTDEDAEGETDPAEGRQISYNTRFKGVKRVRVGPAPREPSSSQAKSSRKRRVIERGNIPRRGRGRPRKNLPTDDAQPATPSVSTRAQRRKEGLAVAPKAKRGRGRPRKSAPIATPEVKGKEVFDGVVLKERVRRSNPHALSTAAATAPNPGSGADTDVGEEDFVDEIILAVNGHDSSLGGSNKENENEMEIVAPDHQPADVLGDANGFINVDMDADGDPDVEA